VSRDSSFLKILLIFLFLFISVHFCVTDIYVFFLLLPLLTFVLLPFFMSFQPSFFLKKQKKHSVGDTRSMRTQQPIEDAESTEMKATLTNSEQQAVDAEQASNTFQSKDPACEALAAEFERIKQLIESDTTWHHDPNLRSIEQNGLKEELALHHVDLVKCGKKTEGSLSNELSHIHHMQQQLKSDMNNGASFLELGFVDASHQLEGSYRPIVETESNDAIVSSPAQLERDREEDLDDDIRASLHSLPETTTTQGNYNHLNVHIDTTSKGDAPLQKPNKEDEKTDEAVLDLLKANV
jgi:hypothetical protein